MNEPENYLLRFWAKTSKNSAEPEAFHPLVCHLIDVAVVAKQIWDKVLPKATKERIARAFGETEFDDEVLEKLGNLVAFTAGLHDLGKCSPPFALRGHNEKGRQTERLLELYRGEPLWLETVEKSKEAPHGYITTIELPEILEENYGFDKKTAEQIGVLIGGHHGVFPNSEWRKNGGKAIESKIGKPVWEKARVDLAVTLGKLLKVEPLEKNNSLKLENGTIMILAGLVSVADWIGSDEKYFQCAVENSLAGEINLKQGSLENYLKHAQTKAVEALQKLGWISRKKETSAEKFDQDQTPDKKFEKLFPFIKNRRHLQNMAIEISEELKTPGIAVIEAPTGEGKTEAAMFLADAWNSSLNQDGYYFALPTQATSNQMFGRAENFLKKRFPDRDVHLQLLHGHASLSAEFETLKKEFRKIRDIFDDQCEGDECVPSVVAAEWFTYRKRGLLAPFGVGTVDQALMAVLQTKHVFVRLFGLAQKTVIIDEVHAYDAYMSTLLERLLEWLAALGSPVILLSATLPANRRDALIKAYLRGLEINEFETLGEDVYPRISYATDSTVKVRHIETSEKSRTLYLEKIGENFVEKLKTKLEASGGCAAIVCNTVQRSQDVFDELSKDEFFQGEASDRLPKLDLLHARFRFLDRERREERVLERFGKPDENGESPHRPKCAVLVATQIIEQSLDLDFDLMISDLAPVDLLLQRAGRIQRHDRDSDKIEEKDKRPKIFRNNPTLWIIKPETDENGLLKPDKKGLPDFGKPGVIYDKHILLRSWLSIEKRKQIVIPDEVERLIEDVYDRNIESSDKNYQDFWEETKRAMRKHRRSKEDKAKFCRISEANEECLFTENSLELDEDDPEKHKDLQALTRDDEMPSVSVIILNQDEQRQVNFDLKPDEETEKFLLMREAKITKWGLSEEIIDKEELKEKTWKQSPLLKHYRYLPLDEKGEFRIGKYVISLDKDLGIVINEERKDG